MHKMLSMWHILFSLSTYEKSSLQSPREAGPCSCHQQENDSCQLLFFVACNTIRSNLDADPVTGKQAFWDRQQSRSGWTQVDRACEGLLREEAPAGVQRTADSEVKLCH